MNMRKAVRYGGLIIGLSFPCVSACAEVTPFTVWTLEARSQLPLWVQWWLYWMFVIVGIGVLFACQAPARWAVTAFVASHLASWGEITLFGADNFVVGMIAINHSVFWTPAAVYLASQLGAYSVTTAFGVWIRLMLFTFCFSLLFDYRDMAIYLLEMT